MYLKRFLEDEIIKASKNYPVVLVTGQRQIGKSTMLYNIKEENRKYVTFDDIDARNLARKDPKLFLENYGYPLIIDEFQRVPDILLEIKRVIDMKKMQGENVNGMYWITGSQKFKIMNDISESLAGRIAVFDMTVLSQKELGKQDRKLFEPDIEIIKNSTFATKENLEYFKDCDIHEIYKRIFYGGMPMILIDKMDKEDYFRNYVNTYLERDIKDLTQVGNLDSFYQFLVYMASITGQELKYANISKEIGVSQPTIKNWVSILERLGIIYILRPYYNKVTDRLVKTPKVYFMDTGLCSYLTKWPTFETLENSNVAGAYLETYVVTEILKTYFNNGKEPNLYYYRDIDKKEIDLLIVEKDKIYPIEIKKSKNPENATKNFNVLDKFGLEIKTGLIMCLCDELNVYDRKAYCYPIKWL